jgi:hypothetical protein
MRILRVFAEEVCLTRLELAPHEAEHALVAPAS